MSASIRSQVSIAAPPERVWAVLTDFAAYPKWNPFIQSISGDLQAGARLTVRIVPPGAKGMTFKPVVTALREQSVLEWLGHLLGPGIFDGRHRFELNRLTDGTTSFVQSEDFGGIIVPLFAGTIAATNRGFDAANRALKERCERS